MSTFTFLTFTRPHAIPSDLFPRLLQSTHLHLYAVYAEEGYSIFNKNIHTKKFLVSVDNFLILTIIMPDYNSSSFHLNLLLLSLTIYSIYFSLK